MDMYMWMMWRTQEQRRKPPHKRRYEYLHYILYDICVFLSTHYRDEGRIKKGRIRGKLYLLVYVNRIYRIIL